MAAHNGQDTVRLFSDVPGDERKVRAILAAWGLPPDEIDLLLSEDAARTQETKRRTRAARHTSPHRPRPSVRPA